MVEMAMFNVQRAIPPKVGKTELRFMCSARHLMCFTFVCSFLKISRVVFNLQSGHEHIVEMAMFNVQRAITPKVGKPELLLMCSARLMMLYICFKFGENISEGIRVMERTQMMEALTDGRTNGHSKFRT